jgi:CubicO group peptidase (beta-lactamase class C family)
LFQAASLSKFVAAVGAMRLVDQKRLSLDTDVNAALTSWKVPTDSFDKDLPVTLRGLLSMTVGVPLPTLTANSEWCASGKLSANHRDRRLRQRLSLFRGRL